MPRNAFRRQGATRGKVLGWLPQVIFITFSARQSAAADLLPIASEGFMREFGKTLGRVLRRKKTGPKKKGGKN